jgi:hypothetical protein
MSSLQQNCRKGQNRFFQEVRRCWGEREEVWGRGWIMAQTMYMNK